MTAGPQGGQTLPGRSVNLFAVSFLVIRSWSMHCRFLAQRFPLDPVCCHGKRSMFGPASSFMSMFRVPLHGILYHSCSSYGCALMGLSSRARLHQLSCWLHGWHAM